MGVDVSLSGVMLLSLAVLVEGERILLVEPNELQAEAIVHSIELDGRRVWIVEFDDPNAILVIYPDPTAPPR